MLETPHGIAFSFPCLLPALLSFSCQDRKSDMSMRTLPDILPHVGVFCCVVHTSGRQSGVAKFTAQYMLASFVVLCILADASLV